MLQQTQVARVLERYGPWLQRWPTPASLAAASAAEVLAAWVGLGYNRRALRLREACAVITRDGWPDDLTQLPGVGEYTAAAVGALAFGRRVVQVDVNVARVLQRLNYVPPADPDPRLGEALMELGALICRAREADCGGCPLAAECPSAHQVTITPRARAGEGRRERFEDSDRWVRGRVVAALAHGTPLPDNLEAGRFDRAVASLVADGLVTEGEDGALRLPDG